MSNSYNFKKAASKELSLSPLMESREKLDTADVIGKTLTVVGFDFVTTANQNGTTSTYPVVIFSEMPDKFYLGGALITKVCQMWASEFDGDPKETSAALAESGGVQFKFSQSKTRSGNSITKIEVV